MIFASPYPNIHVPEESLVEYVLNRARGLGNKPALIDGPSGRSIGYHELAEAVTAMATGLSRRGFGKGDVFAICAPNVPEYAIVFLTVTSLGGLVTTANPLYEVGKLVNLFNDAGAKYLLVTPPFVDKAAQAVAETGIQEIFVLGEAPGATPLSALLQSDGRPPQIEINPRLDVAALHYSSGTTGLPKGVMLTHYNIAANLLQVLGSEAITEDDILFCAPPFFHAFGMMIMLITIHTGATLVSMPRFDPEQFLQLLQTFGPTRLFAAPPIVEVLAKHPLVERYDLSRLAWVLSSGAPLSETVARACSERLNCVVKQGFGMTESLATHLPPDNEAQRKAGSVGLPLANTDCKVVNIDTGVELGPNQEGEIWIRGPQVMQGYLNKEEATGETIDANGWLHTGDIGYVDKDGFLYIVARLKELIRYNGHQVFPTELEAVLLTHPAVADAAVIGRPDRASGQVPVAFVVRKAEASADELTAYVAERVAPYKKIRRIEFVSEIPKSPAGKLLRRMLVKKGGGGVEMRSAMEEKRA